MARLGWALAAFFFFTSAFAQEYAGTWTAKHPNGSVLTLTLQQPGPGAVMGSLEGNGHSFDVNAEVTADGFIGIVTSPEAMVYIGGELRSPFLFVELMEPKPDGEPDKATRRIIRFTR